MTGQAADAPEHGGAGTPLTRRAEIAWLLALLVYAGVLYGWGAGAHDIHSTMEASRAVGARGMVQSGDFMVPRLGPRTYFAKPPLFYWLVAAVSWPGGEVTEFTARFASALCALGTVFALWLFARGVFDPLTALVGGFVLATTPIVLEQAGTAMVNAMLALFTALALFAAFRVTETDRSRWAPAVWCGVALAGGMMTKGPVILLFFAPTLLLYFGFSREWRLTRDTKTCALYLGAASLMFLAALWTVSLAGGMEAPAARGALRGLAGALYLAALAMLLYFGLAGGWSLAKDRRWLVALGVMALLVAVWPGILFLRSDFGELWDTIVLELWTARTTDVGQTNVAPVWYYFVAAPAAALPWTLPLVIGFLKGYRDEGQAGRLLVFARVWALGSLAMFTVVSSAREVRYLLPLYPAAALVCGHAMTRGVRRRLEPGPQRYFDFLMRLTVYAMPVTPFVILGVWLKDAPTQRAMMAVSTGLAVLAAGAGLYLHRVRKSPWAWLFAFALLFLAAGTLINYGIAHRRDEKYSYRPMCEAVEAAVPEGANLWIFGDLRPQVLLYLDGRFLAADPSHPSWAMLREGDAVVASKEAREAFAEAGGGRFGIEKILGAEHRRQELDLFVLRPKGGALADE